MCGRDGLFIAGFVCVVLFAGLVNVGFTGFLDEHLPQVQNICIPVSLPWLVASGYSKGWCKDLRAGIFSAKTVRIVVPTLCGGVRM